MRALGLLLGVPGFGGRRNVSYQAGLVVNGSYEIAGAGGADVFASWTEFANSGAIASDSVTVKHGSKSLKLTGAGASGNPSITQDMAVTPGATLTLSFWTQGNGTVAGRYQVRDVTNNTDIKAIAATEVTAATWARIVYTFVVPALCVSVRIVFASATVAAAVCYFDEVSLNP